MGDKIKAIVSASYSKSLKKFYITSKKAERKRKKLLKYLNNSIVELRQKAVELAESKYSLATDSEDAKKNFKEKLNEYFKQIHFTKLLLKEKARNGLISEYEAGKYYKKFDELEKRAHTLFRIDALRDSATDAVNTYEKYLRYRFMDKDTVIKRLKERLASEEDPEKKKKILKKIKEIEIESARAVPMLNKYDAGLQGYLRDIVIKQKDVDKIVKKAVVDAEKDYVELKTSEKKAKTEKTASTKSVDVSVEDYDVDEFDFDEIENVEESSEVKTSSKPTPKPKQKIDWSKYKEYASKIKSTVKSVPTAVENYKKRFSEFKTKSAEKFSKIKTKSREGFSKIKSKSSGIRLKLRDLF